MKPPAQILDRKTVMDLTFVSEFDLLRQSYADAEILKKPWMAPANRTICTNLHKVLRAQEELKRLNVEVRRLRTWLFVEDKEYGDAVARVTSTGGKGVNFLVAEIQERHRKQKSVNNYHHLVLNKIEALSGFTGEKGIGTPHGWTEAMMVPLRKSAQPVGESDGEDAQELEREACLDDASRLAAQLESLSI